MLRTRDWLLLAVILMVTLALVGCPKPPAGNSESPAGAGAMTNAEPATSAAGAAEGLVTLKVVGPCGMIIPVEEAKSKFESENPGIKLDINYDNSLIIAKKVALKGQACDVFISPGDRQLLILQKAGKIDDSSITPICTFELVVIVPKANPGHITKPEDLLKAKVVSIPNLEEDSTGYAGRAALQELGLWDKLYGKQLIVTSQAIESHNLVAAGKSQAGIAFRNCPLETNPKKLSLSKVSIAFALPADSYVKPQGLLAITKDCKYPDAARKFIAFMASDEGQKIIAKFGLTPLKPVAGSATGSGKATS